MSSGEKADLAALGSPGLLLQSAGGPASVPLEPGERAALASLGAANPGLREQTAGDYVVVEDRPDRGWHRGYYYGSGAVLLAALLVVLIILH